jgi:hypothetical protein
MEPSLRELLGHPVLFHTVLYFGKDGIDNSSSGYLSNDALVIERQLQCMKAFGGPGCGAIGLTYGPTKSSFINDAVNKFAQACNTQDMPFALCFDPWAVKNNDESMPDKATCNSRMIAALQHPDTQAILNLPCYLPGKPVLDFSIGADPATIEAAVPGIDYWLNGKDYDWEYIPNQPNKTKMPCVYVKFDDGTRGDRNKSAWNQSKSCRVVRSNAGRTFWNCKLDGANNCNGKNYVQLVTWNDYDEQTCIEQYASMATGIRI